MGRNPSRTAKLITKIMFSSYGADTGTNVVKKDFSVILLLTCSGRVSILQILILILIRTKENQVSFLILPLQKSK